MTTAVYNHSWPQKLLIFVNIASVNWFMRHPVCMSQDYLFHRAALKNCLANVSFLISIQEIFKTNSNQNYTELST